jgi:hypothetical protein
LRDALAALAALDGQTLEGSAAEAAELLAIVNGQEMSKDPTKTACFESSRGSPATE